MKSASAAAIAHLAQDDLRLTRCLRLTRLDGTIYRFTTKREALTVGAEVFVPVGAGDAANLRANDDLKGQGTDFEFPFEATAITEADVRAGRLDHALLELYVAVDWAASPPALVQDRRIRLGNWEWDNGTARVEARDLAQMLEDTVGNVFTADCTRNLGDSVCGVNLNPDAWAAATSYAVRQAGDVKVGDYVKMGNSAARVWQKCTRAGVSGAVEPTWNTTPGGATNEGGSPLGPAWEAFAWWGTTGAATGAASGTDARRVFSDSSLTEADGYWDEGLVTWLTGDNAGVAMEIESFGAAGSPSVQQVLLRLDLPNDIQVGDTYSITKGCNKSTDCAEVFDNIFNQRAPGRHMPGTERMLQTPDASGQSGPLSVLEGEF